VDQFTLANGAVTGAKTQSLPGGTYKVYAHYAGDGTNAPSDSAMVQVTVGKEASQVFIVIPTFDSQTGAQLSGNASTVQYGSPYIIRMYVGNSAATASGNGAPTSPCYTINEITCPTGSVALSANGTAIDGGTFTLNNEGYTRDIAPTLTGGTYPLVAKYAGDNSYNTSTSAIDTFTVTPAPTSQQWTNNPSFVVIGVSFSLGVVVDTGVAGVSPTGSVIFYDGATALPGTVSYSAQGQGTNVVLYANTMTTISSGGAHSITAKYSGDANFQPSTGSPVSLIAKYASAIALHESATTVNFGQSITVNAVLTGSNLGPTPNGQFQFYGSSTAITAPPTIVQSKDSNGNPVLTASVSTLPQSSEVICANYNGDANYTDANSSCDFVTVNIPDFTLTPANGVSIVPAAGQTGSVAFTVSPASQSQLASTVILALGVGYNANTIAGYSIALSPAQVNLAGSPISAAITLTPNVSVPANAARTLKRNYVAFGFWHGIGGAMTAITVLAGILVLFPLSRLPRVRSATSLGACCVLAFAMGCGGGGTSVGGGGGGGSSAGPTSIAIATSNAKVPQFGALSLDINVSASKPLTGTVGIYDFGNLVTNVGLVNGQAQFDASSLFGIGVHQLTASYNGDSNNLASHSTTLTQVITGTIPMYIQASTGGDVHNIQATVGVQ
jgi:hypothetical protein